MKHQHTEATPNRLSLFSKTAVMALAVLFFAGVKAHAVNYSGNGDTGFGGAIGEGVLGLTDDGTTISGTLTVAPNNMNDALVIYIDTGAGGGFSDTSGFGDANDGLRRAISGYNGGQRSLMTFMSGFAPQYAIALGPSDDSYGGLFGLANGTNNSLNFIASVNLSPFNNVGPYTFSFPASDIGLTPGVQKTIKIFGTYTSDSSYRANEAIAGNDSGNQGWNPFTQTAFATYTFDAGAPTMTPVNFSVDMTTMLTNGFNPAGGDKVVVSGSFVTVPGTLVTLTNNPGAANPNIYSGSYLDENPTNTVETCRFAWIPAADNVTNYENSDARPFTLAAGGVTVPLVYFSDFAPATSATTNSVTFQVDMTDQIQLGAFNPATEQVEVWGTMNQYYSPGATVPIQWTQNVGIMTNNPNGANTNLYSITLADGNYPGSWEQYKFIIVNGSTPTYEYTANRDFATPNGSTTLPVAFFDNISNVVTVPITFQVDMTSEAANLTNAGVSPNVGIFTGGNPGGVLTNNPGAANPNIYTGTFVLTQQPGTTYQYKFEVVSNGVTTYEKPVSTGGNNRIFTLGTTAATLPLVYWSDEDPNNVLPAGTTITFTIDMNGAVDKYGVPFDPSVDAVIIDGDFLQPNGWNNAIWTDGLPTFDYPAEQMQEVGLTTLYTNSFVVPAGAALQVNYKYGIVHNYTSVANTNCDNEAPVNDNHLRYIRSVGSYSFPTDVFGGQTNGADPAEISFGNLAAANGSPGTIAVTWLGRPGVYLQSTTNLASRVWTTITNSDGLMATNVPAAPGASVFFRLVNP